MAASLCFYKVKEGMFKKLLHDPRHSFCNWCHNLLVLDKRQRKTSYFIRPVLRSTFRKEQLSEAAAMLENPNVTQRLYRVSEKIQKEKLYQINRLCSRDVTAAMLEE